MLATLTKVMSSSTVNEVKAGFARFHWDQCPDVSNPEITGGRTLRIGTGIGWRPAGRPVARHGAVDTAELRPEGHVDSRRFDLFIQQGGPPYVESRRGIFSPVGVSHQPDEYRCPDAQGGRFREHRIALSQSI